jgi:regulator of protease activity HflC (stomatin/prohibitin superfamily)
MQYVALYIVLIALVIISFRICVRRITVFEYEKALKYTNGKFGAVLAPGVYWYIPFFVSIHKIDVRPRFASITGQEILSSDGVSLKVSLAANFEISDPYVAVNKVQSFQEALYLELQLVLREIIGSADIDTVLNSRGELSKKVMAMTSSKAQDLGLKLISVNLKDIMFPGKLKEMFAQVVNARKEGLAALEKARSERAALRNLANAAKMIESNPSLMQLRLVQALGGSSGNTLILGMPSQAFPIPIKTPKARKEKDLPGAPQEGPQQLD